MEALVGAFGICFILRGVFTFLGRGIPENVIKKMQDPERIKGWHRGMGAVHILWGVCAVLIWCMNQFPDYSLYTLVFVVICAVLSIGVSWVTLKK